MLVYRHNQPITPKQEAVTISKTDTDQNGKRGVNSRTVRELISLLEKECDPDAELVVTYQPSYPLTARSERVSWMEQLGTEREVRRDAAMESMTEGRAETILRGFVVAPYVVKERLRRGLPLAPTHINKLRPVCRTLATAQRVAGKQIASDYTQRLVDDGLLDVVAEEPVWLYTTSRLVVRRVVEVAPRAILERV